MSDSIQVRIAPLYRGKWNNSTAYNKLDVVVYEPNKNTYICKQNAPAGTLPTNTAYFELYIDNSENVGLEQRVTNLENDVANLEITKIYEFGVRIYQGQASSSLTRLGDAAFLTANASKNGAAVTNDFDELPIFSEIKRTKRHKTTHALLAVKGDADFDIVSGEEMVDYPDTYWKFEEAEDHSYFDMYVCNVQKSGYTKVPKFSVGAYPLSVDENGNIQTKAGYAAEGWKGLTTWRSAVASAYGEGACLLDWRYDLITALYLIEFADYNSQAKLGQGHCSHRNNIANDKSLLAETNTNRIVVSTAVGNYFNVGEYVQLGTSDGGRQVAYNRKITAKETYNDGTISGVALILSGNSFNTTTSVGIQTQAQECGDTDDVQASSGCMANDGKHGVKYRHFERNSIFDWIDGRTIKNGVIYECTDPTEYVSDKTTSPYEALSYGVPSSGNNGYITKLGFDKNHPFCRMTEEAGGTGSGSSSYVTDYSWWNPSGTFACRVGGYPSFGANDGLFSWHLANGSSNAIWHCGARVLMYQI